ncbi:uncharacterized protein J8A68_001783 [[Candida] subhashii]|uniref:Bromo domain-containing protein n=1 Tax=[Candida] subhashii TaxID=561895 RepID=A0A8J5QT31_9ASCO|nr:uncharacterized protein J8A68_001783 [[Candida] subhashii]KAG7664687.1 hypothetical protein J8A68_001783 [[Candida] subhashii]
MPPKRKGSSATSTPKKAKPNHHHPSPEEYKQFFQSTLNLVSDLRDENDEQLAFPFVKLPSKKLYPDYYQIIAQPICLNDIQKRIRTKYTGDSTDEFLDDFQLLLDNATNYNAPDSWIVLNATKIYEFVKDQVREFESAASSKKVEPPKFKLKFKQPEPVKPKVEQPEITFGKLPEICIELLEDVMNHDFPDDGVISGPFIEDVDTDYYTDYLTFVEKPMSFNKLISMLKSKKLFSPKFPLLDNLNKFHETAKLIFSNARLYNDESSQIHQDANNLEEYFEEKYQELKNKIPGGNEDTAKTKGKSSRPTLKIHLGKAEPATSVPETPKKKGRRRKAVEVKEELEEPENEIQEEELPVKYETTKPQEPESTIRSKQVVTEKSIDNTMGKTLPLLPAESAIIQESALFSTVAISNHISQFVQQKAISSSLLPLPRNQEIRKGLFPTHPGHSVASLFEYKVPANGYTNQSYSITLPNEISPFVSFKVSLHNFLYNIKKNDLVNGRGYLNSTSDEDFQCKLFVNDEEVSNAGDCFEEKREGSDEHDDDELLGVQYDLKLSYGLNVLVFECKVAPNISKQIKNTVVQENNEEIAGRHTRHQLQQLKMSWDVETITMFVTCNCA